MSEDITYHVPQGAAPSSAVDDDDDYYCDLE